MTVYLNYSLPVSKNSDGFSQYWEKYGYGFGAGIGVIVEGKYILQTYLEFNRFQSEPDRFGSPLTGNAVVQKSGPVTFWEASEMVKLFVPVTYASITPYGLAGLSLLIERVGDIYVSKHITLTQQPHAALAFVIGGGLDIEFIGRYTLFFDFKTHIGMIEDAPTRFFALRAGIHFE